MRTRTRLLNAVIATIVVASALAAAQNVTFKREQAELILDEVADDVAKHYYDPKLQGIDWDAKLREAKKKIENATSSNLAFANVAAMLDSLNDSHTFFMPPQRSFALDYGWRIQTIGDRCLVTRVRPETDAASKVHPGDEVLDINGYKPTRANMARIDYVLNVLRPQSKIEVTLRSVVGQERQVEIVPKLFPRQLVLPTVGDLRIVSEREYKRTAPRLVSLDGDVLVGRIPVFEFDEGQVHKLVSAARKHKWVILDLRGNPGGMLDSLNFLISGFFDHEVKIADAVSREGTKARLVKPDHQAFSGKLIVLVDSRSTSAAEVFARVVQLEKRGLVVGERTPGMVMEARTYGHVSAGVVFGVSVTVANLIMSDGNSLEHIGVTPDEPALPTADDIANGRDPVLAHAAEIAGAKLSPQAATELFPYEWQELYSFAGH